MVKNYAASSFAAAATTGGADASYHLMKGSDGGDGRRLNRHDDPASDDALELEDRARGLAFETAVALWEGGGDDYAGATPAGAGSIAATTTVIFFVSVDYVPKTRQHQWKWKCRI